MTLLLSTQAFNCVTNYALKKLSLANIDLLKSSFDNLPLDPYLQETYRSRRLSRFKYSDQHFKKIPHACLYQSQNYNPLLGGVIREYAELSESLVQSREFQACILAFFEFCQICSSNNEIGVHQIRTTTSLEQVGEPAPEGIHRDGVQWVGILCIHRQGIKGGETHLCKTNHSSPIFSKVLDPGELLVFNDAEFLHYTTPIEVISAADGIRDVFVFTCPGLLPPKN